MRAPFGIVALLALASVAALTTGCQVSRYRYLSFEAQPDVDVQSVAPVEVENLVFGSTIPVEYSLGRDGYALRISIDPKSYFPNAAVELADSPGVQLVPRPARGASSSRPRPCGSYDDIAASGKGFEFSWVICGNDASPEELVVAFDVIGEDFGIKEESLHFTLRSGGVYWLRDSL